MAYVCVRSKVSCMCESGGTFDVWTTSHTPMSILSTATICARPLRFTVSVIRGANTEPPFILLRCQEMVLLWIEGEQVHTHVKTLQKVIEYSML
jgi:hypothetical protein